MHNIIKKAVRKIVGPVYWAKWKLRLNKNDKNAFYDTLTVEIFRKSLQEDSICIDVGCHAGSVLREMIRFCPRGKFYAFEPLPDFYQYLSDNFGSNASIKLFPIALSNKKGSCSFNYVISNPGYSGFLNRYYPPSEKETQITVATDTLDGLIEENDRISLIKIDVEGAELQVLQGGIHTIKRDKPIIVFEHGRGAADFYGTRPDDIFSLLCEECGMEISLVENWLTNKKSLSKEKFLEQFNRGLNFYFVASARRNSQ